MWKNQRVASFFAGGSGPSFNNEEADKAVDKYIDYFCGRAIKADLSGDSVNSCAYNQDSYKRLEDIVANMSRKSNYEKVIEFNRAFQLDVPSGPQPELFTKDPALVRLKLDLIREEVKELEDAVKDHDLRETVDALADILYVVYGAGITFGIDMDKAFDLVHQSNMSKLCPTEENAKETVQWYKEKYEKGTSPYDTPDYRRDDNSGLFIVYNKSSGKVLKSITYKPVNLDPVL
jgi:predicted HAD superfamily Cof-like phosphohydrolase